MDNEYSSQKEKFENGKVNDNFKIVYALCGTLGLVHSLPMTFFTTANDYWMYKFRNTSFEEADSDHRTTLQIEFSPSVTISTNVATVSFYFLILMFGDKLNLKLKLYGSLVATLIFYVVAAIFIHVDTDSWQTFFFTLTMITIAGINAMGAVFGLSLFSVIVNFPTEYLGAYLFGQGLGGVFTGLLQTLSLAIGITTKSSALMYFWIAIGLILFGLLFMITVDKCNIFYNHHNVHKNNEAKRKNMSIREFLDCIKLIWKTGTIYVLLIFMYNFTHPAITSLVVSEGKGNGDWNDVYFVPVITFVLFASMDYIGRMVTIRFKFLARLNGIWYILLATVRLALIPLVMLCNAQPRTHMSVLFPHDYQYIIIIIAFGLTNGYLTAIGSLIIPEIVPSEKLEDAYHVNLVLLSVTVATLSFLGFVSIDLL